MNADRYTELAHFLGHRYSWQYSACICGTTLSSLVNQITPSRRRNRVIATTSDESIWLEWHAVPIVDDALSQLDDFGRALIAGGAYP